MPRIYKEKLFFYQGHSRSDPIILVGVAVGDTELPSGADPGEEIHFDLVVGLFIRPIKPAMSLHLAFPKRGGAYEKPRQEGDSPIGEGR